MLTCLIKKTLRCYNELDLLDDLRITVLEDKHGFGDAFTIFVRGHFKDWSDNVEEEGARERSYGARKSTIQALCTSRWRRA